MSRTLRPAALLFDLDGTLADSFQAIRHALTLATAELGLPARSLAWVRRHVGRGAAALVVDAVGRRDDDTMVARLGDLFARHYREVYLDETPPRAGAQEVLSVVAARTGGKVGVVSNKDAALCREWLAHWDLAPHVAVVSGPDTAGVTKPDARAVSPVLDALDVAGGDALLVGDMPIDAEAARNAGLAAVLVEGGAASRGALHRAGALAVLPEIRALLPWLAHHGAGWR